MLTSADGDEHAVAEAGVLLAELHEVVRHRLGHLPQRDHRYLKREMWVSLFTDCGDPVQS